MRKRCLHCGQFLPSEVRKKCNICGKRKALSKFPNNRLCKDGKESVCKECRMKDILAWQNENPDKIRIYKRNCLRNRARREGNWAFGTKWWKEHPEKWKAHQKKYASLLRANLADHYVKSILQRNYGFKWDEIPPELIDMKREQLEVFRKMRPYRRNRDLVNLAKKI